MHKYLEILYILDAESIAKNRFVSLYTSLAKPESLNYKISGFAITKNLQDSDEFKLKMKHLHGVQANFEYEMDGLLRTLNSEIENENCTVMVNSMAGEDYFKNFPKGIIGDGRIYESGRFLFRLYITPDMAKNIIERKLLADKIINEEMDSREDSNEEWLVMRIDIVNYNEGREDPVEFDIFRIYC